jgi:hypothetical protein
MSDDPLTRCGAASTRAWGVCDEKRNESRWAPNAVVHHRGTQASSGHQSGDGGNGDRRPRADRRTGLDAMTSAAEGGPESTGVPQPGESLAADDVPRKDTAGGGASPPVIGSERVEPTSQPSAPRHLGRDSFDAPERPSVVSRHSVDATRTSGSGTTETAIAGHSVTADGTESADEPPSAGTPVDAHRSSSGPSLQREPRDGGPRTTENRGPSGT